MKKIYSVLLIVILLSVAFSGCGNESAASANKTVAEGNVEIKTAYGSLQFPEDLMGKLKHLEVQEGNTAMEVFYMVTDGGEMELFRIYYFDHAMGERMGTLTIDEKKIPVSYAVCEYNEEDFPDEETMAQYHEMMKAFNTVLLSITEDSRFLADGAAMPREDIQAKLKYWTTTVKENMEWEETVLDGGYRVDFYGIFSGEKIPLYTIALGDMECDSVLGVYDLDGQTVPISLKVHELPSVQDWPEEALTEFYRMMDTMNNLITEIMEDRNYDRG